MRSLRGEIVLESWKLLLPHNKHLFVGSENRSALSMQFQLFAVARGDRFLGNGRRRARLSSVLMSVTAIFQQLSDFSAIAKDRKPLYANSHANSCALTRAPFGRSISAAKWGASS